MMLEARIESYEQLIKEEQENVSNNGCGKEYASYIRVLHNGKTVLLESDAMEPEDAIFCRDLSWIQEIILQSYKLGKIDGKIEILKGI